ncbi:MAG: hypothetical protein WD266_05240 [Balneolales bacterium]
MTGKNCRHPWREGEMGEGGRKEGRDALIFAVRASRSNRLFFGVSPIPV